MSFYCFIKKKVAKKIDDMGGSRIRSWIEDGGGRWGGFGGEINPGKVIRVWIRCCGYLFSNCLVHLVNFITARKRSLEQGNIFTSVCQEFCSQRGGGCLVTGCVPGPGGVCAWSRGVCLVPGGVEIPPGMATAAGSTHPTGMYSL